MLAIGDVGDWTLARMRGYVNIVAMILAQAPAKKSSGAFSSGIPRVMGRIRCGLWLE